MLFLNTLKHMGYTVEIKDGITKRVRKFIHNGQVFDGGAEVVMGHNMGGAGQTIGTEQADRGEEENKE
jgi:hypothetical protein